MQLKLRHAHLLATINIRASQLLHMRRCAVPEGKIPLLDSDPGTGTLIFIHATIRWDAKQEITHLPTDKTVLSIYENTGAEFFLKNVAINPYTNGQPPALILPTDLFCPDKVRAWDSVLFHLFHFCTVSHHVLYMATFQTTPCLKEW